MLNGWIILDKPTGITSAHAVAKVKRLLRPSKIGHAGTLDPLASGILPLALGEGTKTIPYVTDASKSYSFTVNWGEKRSTDDREGGVIASSDKRPSEQDIIELLPRFIGTISQTPPAFSAIKVNGERAYDLARSGEVVELAARNVVVTSLKISEYTPDYTTFICDCGKGTYIRSLARDMGDLLGCFGHVSMLRRLRVGKFTENRAISLENLAEMVHKGALDFLLSVESALDDIPALDITSSQAMLLKRGQTIPVQGVSQETLLARCDGKAIAICSSMHGQLKPIRVFNL